MKLNKSIINDILEFSSQILPEIQNWTLNIIFEDDEKIRALNKEYRWIDKSTDVLSFHYADDFSNFSSKDTAWEVILSEKLITEHAEEFDNSFSQECYKMIIHSVLHILWYDHEDDAEYVLMNWFESKISELISDKYWIIIK